jgi:hypothetical protein
MVIRSIIKVFRYLFWISIILSVILVLIFFFGAKQVGVLEAKYDLWRGRYEIHGYGLTYGVSSNVENLNAHGIKYRHVAGCVVNDFIIVSVGNYNLMMKAAIKKDLDYDIDERWIWPYVETVDGKYTKRTEY